jgi:adenylate kinase
MEAAVTSGHPIKAVIFLDLNEQHVWKRFEATQSQNDRGFRHDDAEHVLEVRLAEFRSKTLPVIEFYRDKGLLIELSGSGDPDEVTERIISKLFEIAKPN